jgi:hypothetical protein
MRYDLRDVGHAAAIPTAPPTRHISGDHQAHHAGVRDVRHQMARCQFARNNHHGANPGHYESCLAPTTAERPSVSKPLNVSPKRPVTFFARWHSRESAPKPLALSVSYDLLIEFGTFQTSRYRRAHISHPVAFIHVCPLCPRNCHCQISARVKRKPISFSGHGSNSEAIEKSG